MLTPRREEREAIVELLESEGFETPDQLAGAILKASFALFQRRDLFGIAVDHAGKRVAYGPFATEKDAERAYVRLGVGTGYVAQLWAAERTIPTDEPDKDRCATCAHPKGPHTHLKSAGRCQARGCDCQTFVP